MKIDTTVLTQFNGIITAVVGMGMIIIVGKNMLSGKTYAALMSVLLAGLLLWAVNDLNGFVEMVKLLVNFVGGVFGG
jgi:hypothetical protein